MDSIKKNITLERASFIVKLHEDSIFDIKLISDVINETIDLVKKSKNKLTDIEINEYIKGLYFITYESLGAIIAHYNPKDLYTINDYNDSYMIYIERLHFCTEMLLNKDYDSIIGYTDELGSIK